MSKSPNSHNEIDVPARPKRKTPRIARRTWLYVALFGSNLLLVAVTVGWAVSLRDAASHHVAAATPEVAPPVDMMRTILRGDELQTAGKLDPAMAQYRLAAEAGTTAVTALTYRMAVCAEGQGQLDRAREYFSAAMDHTNSPVALASQLGQARIAYRQGNFLRSFELLAPLAMRSASTAVASTEIGSDVDYLLALVNAAASLQALPASELQPNHVFQYEAAFPVEHLLRLVPLDEEHVSIAPLDGDNLRQGISLRGAPTKPNTTLVSANIQDEPVSVVLDSLAAATSWKVSLSAGAQEIVGAKRVRLLVRDKTAGEVLSLLLYPQQLFWLFEDDSLVIKRIDDIPREQVESRQRERADQLLASALGTAPDHFLSPQAYLAMGNLAWLNRRADRAATYYREVIERFPGHAIGQTARFNLAKMLFDEGDLPGAIETAYQVVDQRRGSELEPLAYLYLGRFHFDHGDAKRAKADLSRSHGLATTPSVAATAALSLASIYLLDRDDQGAAGSANHVLMERRELLRAEPYRTTAAFLSALTRFRAAVASDDVRRTGRELVAAAIKVDPHSFFGDFGILLVGDAFSELNLSEEAVRVYQLGLTGQVCHLVRDELSFRLARQYRDRGEYRLAREMLLELSSSPSTTWASRAAVELADLLLQSGDLMACARHCRRALGHQHGEAHQIELLRMLGSVYEQLGDHENASICFAGYLPSDEPVLFEAKR